MAGEPQYVNETEILQRIASEPRCRWKWSRHALAKMKERGITKPDVKMAMMTGKVVLEEYKKDILWRIIGKDIDGSKIFVSAAVYEEEIIIKVVTSFPAKDGDC
jgi:hypothetical protein